MKTIEELQKELEEMQATAKALASKNERLEDESRKNKERAKTAEELIAEQEKAKLQEQGKLEELLQKEREEKKLLQNTLSDRDNKIIKANLRAEVAKYAKDAHSVDRLLSVTEHKDLLKIKDDLTVEGAEEFVKKCRETDYFLFKKKALDDTETSKGGLDTRSQDEKYYAELNACSSRKELDEVKKKYGK
jgi:hypothetical protein